MKQGEENTKFVKNEEEPTRKYIFQNNTKTKTAFYFILAALILLIIAVAITGFGF
ncbi:hypothetical protein HME9304_00176 [Flagellimonas maritima]|uniref:Uncharacterized protein n=1 Tax=Flagellimonas maritima TaxID=1383885 RepID=A0A2Z4LN23_9FLAO|nr:hypothetical protein [Allomuricauda aurantiaca]AWX43189.1 hypothetical protein HME9304_00176 [Allomuricauda aurantiaca]